MKRWDSSSSGNLIELTIQSTFRETTRSGAHKGFVYIVLTPHVLLINEPSYYAKIPKSYDINSFKLAVFKKSSRQTLKIIFVDGSDRYFELEKTTTKKAMWIMWCKKVITLQRVKTDNVKMNTKYNNSLDWNIAHYKWKPQHFIWSDKCTYLGSQRENEDKSRPRPVPGRVPTEDMKLWYLKPQYFGCFDQSEHWVQCESNFGLSKHVDNNI